VGITFAVYGNAEGTEKVWMARYVERAENVARFIDVNHNLEIDQGDTVREQWAPLVYTTGDEETFRKHYDSMTRENVIRFLAFDRENPNSILSCVRSARENARTIREVISSSMWEELNKFYHLVRAAESQLDILEQPYDFCHRLKTASHLHVGVTDCTMSHNEAWHFARMGRLLERADKTSRIVDVKYFILLPKVEFVGSSLDIVQWSALLKSASALEMYRRAYGRIVPLRVADYLILDRDFPRSMHFCVMKAAESLQMITGSSSGTYRYPAEQRLGLLRSQMDYAGIDGIIEQGLHEYVDGFQTQLNRIGQAIFEDFFAMKPTSGAETVDRTAAYGQWQMNES
jgi:uncharacterized alpha-E superfamily protein